MHRICRTRVRKWIGKRDQESANLLLDRVNDVTDGHIPFFTSDQLPKYEDALLQTYGTWVTPERKGSRGRCPHPRLIPVEDLPFTPAMAAGITNHE